MINKKETAEQKLLKMIETSAGPDAISSKTQQKVRKKQSLLTMIKGINKLLVVGLIMAIVFLSYEVHSGMAFLNQKDNFSAQQTVPDESIDKKSLTPTIQHLSYYLAGIKRRNLFQPYEKKVVAAADATEDNRKIRQKIATLKLVGISWLDKIDTASVMIEDTEKGVTYFLQKDEKIGDIIVKTIYAESAVLGYEDEEIIIRYDKSQM